MKKKYYNDAIIGNENISASFSTKGELLRFFYPTRDCRQFVDTMYTGIKVNDSSLIYLHDDINNAYNQYYTQDTNILNTEIYNSYFNVHILQTDFVLIDKDIVVKKYKVTNKNTIKLDIDFLIYSKLLSSFNNMVGTRVENDIFMQYSHNYTYSLFSKLPIKSYCLNNSEHEMKKGELADKDYIAMANDSALCYNVGSLEPGESKEIDIFIYINQNRETYKFDEIMHNIEKIKELDIEKEFKKVRTYWEKYVVEHDGLEIIKNADKWEEVLARGKEPNDITYNKLKNLIKIYTRSILIFPLLLNKKTGGISAAIEVDEEKDKCGRYSYCWPRDAVFTAKALDILRMEEDVDNFYTKFSANTQSDNGMWEQRFYTDGKLAPCWGYQIDETASVVFGVYTHYYNTKSKEFLKQNFEMCRKAIKYLKGYLYFIARKEEYTNKYNELRRFETSESYDLWEMFEGVHIYSLGAIYAAFAAMENIYRELEIEDKKEIEKLEKFQEDIKAYCLKELCDEKTGVLKRNNKDNVMDISILGTVMPFRMFDPKQKEVVNTIEKMKLTLKTYTGGYLRFENDSYIGGKNPWIISTLWMALYNIQIDNDEEAYDELDLVLKTATEHGFLAEQIDNETKKAKWVIGLAWSHAIFIITLYSLGLKNGIIKFPPSNKKFGKGKQKENK